MNDLNAAIAEIRAVGEQRAAEEREHYRAERESATTQKMLRMIVNDFYLRAIDGSTLEVEYDGYAYRLTITELDE